MEGFVTHEPVVRKTKTGKTVCTFSIAVSNSSQTQAAPHMNYFDVETWNRLAEFCSGTISKGKLVQVSGRLRQDRWEGADGKMRSRIMLVGRTVKFLEKLKFEKNRKEENQIVQVS